MIPGKFQQVKMQVLAPKSDIQKALILNRLDPDKAVKWLKRQLWGVQI